MPKEEVTRWELEELFVLLFNLNANAEKREVSEREEERDTGTNGDGKWEREKHRDMDRHSDARRERERAMSDRTMEKVMRVRNVTKAEGWDQVAEALQPLR